MIFRESIKRILPSKFFALARKMLYPEKINLIEDRLNSFFKTYYQHIAASDLDQKTALRNAEFKIFSKNGGDGILLYIFSKVGCTNRAFVEIGVEDGRECNTANLSLNFGWKGLLVDANGAWIKSADLFYKEKLGKMSANIKTAACFVTAENINQLLSDNGVNGEIDLLSLDIDGNDYWVWKAINSVNPRVIVAEYNSAFGLRPITMKYDPAFSLPKNSFYFGASLTALAKLFREKGYILIGCDCQGHDAFFVRQDVAQGKLVELAPEEAFYPNPNMLKTVGSLEEQFEQIKDRDFETV